MDQPLSGRHALVTGGGRGIGAAIAGALAAAGARVTLLGRTASELEATAASLPGGALAVTADVTDAKQVEHAFGRARTASGEVSILVNNAGLAKSRALAKSDEEFWRMMLDVNLTGAYHCTRAAIPAMLAANWGRIVNVSSTAGLRGYAYCTAYCAAKHGLVGMTRALALEVAKTGITVNAVCPGYTDTGIVRDAIRNISEKTARSETEARETLVVDQSATAARAARGSRERRALALRSGQREHERAGHCHRRWGGELMADPCHGCRDARGSRRPHGDPPVAADACDQPPGRGSHAPAAAGAPRHDAAPLRPHGAARTGAARTQDGRAVAAHDGDRAATSPGSPTCSRRKASSSASRTRRIGAPRSCG